MSEKDYESKVKLRVAEELKTDKNAESKDDSFEGISYHFITRCLGMRDVGDGMLLSEVERGNLVFNHREQLWMLWNGYHWVYDHTERSKVRVERAAEAYFALQSHCIERAAKLKKDNGNVDDIKELESRGQRAYKKGSRLREEKNRNVCLRAARSNEISIDIVGDEIDKKPLLWPVANGVINLKTGEIEDGNPNDYLVRASKVEWKGLEEPCPEWEKALLDMMGGEQDKVDFLQRLFGYAATGLTTEQIFVVFSGQGRNGKGVVVDLITEVMGDFAGSIQSELLLEQPFAKSAGAPTPEIMDLNGLRMGFASETDDGRKFSASRVKLLSGDDQLVGRKPHATENIRFSPTHQLFLMTNSKPHITSGDFAFWQRIWLVEFMISFVSDPKEENEKLKDPDLKDELKKELSGIMAWIVKGCLRWQEEGINPPKSIVKATKNYRREEDTFSDFIEECLIIEDVPKEEYVTASRLLEVYQKWWVQNMSTSKKPPAQNVLGRMMREKKMPSVKVHTAKERGRKCYYGIRIKQEMEVK